MFSGEIGSLQPRTSYAVARTIGSREMAQTRLHDASIKTQSKQRRLRAGSPSRALQNVRRGTVRRRPLAHVRSSIESDVKMQALRCRGNTGGGSAAIDGLIDKPRLRGDHGDLYAALERDPVAGLTITRLRLAISL